MGRGTRLWRDLHYNCWQKEIIEKWDIAEWGDEQEIDGFTVAQCTKSGGRNEFGDPKYGQYLFILTMMKKRVIVVSKN